MRLLDLADGFRVIIGEEISSRDGEISGLVLTRAIPRDLSAGTIAPIREQHGVVVVPHPFSRSRPHRLRRDALDRIWPQIALLVSLRTGAGRDGPCA